MPGLVLWCINWSVGLLPCDIIVGVCFFFPAAAVDNQRSQPIPVSEFAAHVDSLHARRDLGFEEEYSVSAT